MVAQGQGPEARPFDAFRVETEGLLPSRRCVTTSYSCLPLRGFYTQTLPGDASKAAVTP